MSLEEQRRGPGRPRDARADAVILEAAIEAFLEDGYQGLSVEGVAARAGVGKTTIYRRWASKEDLIAAAVSGITEHLDIPDTGSLRGDLIEMINRLRSSRLSGQSLPRLVAELSANPALGPIYRDNVVGPRHDLLVKIFQRGVERGELRDDVPFEVVLDLVVGPVILGGLLGQIDHARVPRSAEALIDALLTGLAPH